MITIEATDGYEWDEYGEYATESEAESDGEELCREMDEDWESLQKPDDYPDELRMRRGDEILRNYSKR